MKPQKHRHAISPDGTHADLKRLVIRLPFAVASGLTLLAGSDGKTVSLYISNVLQKHCEGPNEES